MKLAIYEKDTNYATYLTRQIESWFEEHQIPVKLSAFCADELWEQLGAHGFDFDIAFVAIKLQDCDGIRLAQKINLIAPECRIIFLSDDLDLATEVYDASHIYFILKKELEKRLPFALKKAVQIIPEKNINYITITYKSKKLSLRIHEILYAEIYGRTLTIILTSGEKYNVNLALKKLHRQLPDFLRIHNSFLVNPANIRSLTNEICILSNQIQLPVSRTYAKKATENYRRYLAN